MACNCNLITGGIDKSCLNNTGGVATILITDACNIATITAATGSISAITMTGGALFYEYAFNKNTSSYSEDITINLENGSTFFAQSVNLVIPRR